MTREKALKAANAALPALGIAIMAYYHTCGSSCAYLKGTLAGVDLKIVGVVFMLALIALAFPLPERLCKHTGSMRAAILSGALGGEVLLVRFQVIEDIFCPFCLAFGICVLVLFVVNVPRMNKAVAAFFFLAGLIVFSLLFNGSVVPSYY